MSRIALTTGDMRMKAIRRGYVPIGSTIAACLVTLLPVIVSTPILPDFGFMMLIAWRLLRPEIWSPHSALPLGLFNDLIAAHPIGQSMALWTIAFLAFDYLDTKLVFRDFWIDWFFASLMIAAYIAGGWYISRLMGSGAELSIIVPPLIASILSYPVITRIVLTLDRWRLTR